MTAYSASVRLPTFIVKVEKNICGFYFAFRQQKQNAYHQTVSWPIEKNSHIWPFDHGGIFSCFWSVIPSYQQLVDISNKYIVLAVDWFSGGKARSFARCLFANDSTHSWVVDVHSTRLDGRLCRSSRRIRNGLHVLPHGTFTLYINNTLGIFWMPKGGSWLTAVSVCHEVDQTMDCMLESRSSLVSIKCRTS